VRKIIITVTTSAATLLVGLGIGHLSAPAPADHVCASAAFLAYDAYATDRPSAQLRGAMDKCAATVGGF